MQHHSVRDKAEYAIALTREFAKAHELTEEQAFRYLDRYNGISFILDNYNIAHTLSFMNMVVALGDVCTRNGGKINTNDIKDKEWLNKI